MTVLLLDNVLPSLKGELSRWMIEPKAGVFVGNLSALVREKIWEKILQNKQKCKGGMLLHSTNNEQGYDIIMFGETKRIFEDYDGLKLIKILKT
jgi:CRISPR-associated protein Cas2